MSWLLVLEVAMMNEWKDIAAGYGRNWLEPIRSKMADYWLPVDFEPHYAFIVTREYAKWHTHQCHDSSEANNQFSSVQSLSRGQLCDQMDCSMPGLPVHHQLPEFTETHVHWVGDAIKLSHPLSSPSPPTFTFPIIRVFSNESVLHMRWPKYWSFSFNISPTNE